MLLQALMKATTMSHQPAVATLLLAKASPDMMDKSDPNGMTALEYAAQKCKLLPTVRPFVLNAEGNHFGETGERLIKLAIKFSKVFAGVRL